MNLPVIQIVKFNNYINGNSMFGTHQGVKGLEFDRVLVIIDEKESNMPLFNYNKLLEWNHCQRLISIIEKREKKQR